MVPKIKAKHLLILAAALLGLSGCVAYPADPYYSYSGGYYGGGYYPYYYGPPVTGTVIFGGGPHYYHHRHWR
jgi:hypothetical protein